MFCAFLVPGAKGEMLPAVLMDSYGITAGSSGFFCLPEESFFEFFFESDSSRSVVSFFGLRISLILSMILCPLQVAVGGAYWESSVVPSLPSGRCTNTFVTVLQEEVGSSFVSEQTLMATWTSQLLVGAVPLAKYSV